MDSFTGMRETGRRFRRCHVVVVLLLALATGCGNGVGSGPDAGSSESLRDRSIDELVACVEAHFPAERYLTNDFLPASLEQARGLTATTVETVRVGMPWIRNDETAYLYIGMEQGYFREAGFELELRPGGPGIDPLANLASGAIDVAISATSLNVARLVTSRTPADVVMVGALLKRNPYIWLTLDENTPRDERSDWQPTLADTHGKRVGIQPGYEFFLEWVLEREGLQPGDLRIIKAGPTPETLINGVTDFYAGWIVNQPRLLEARGYHNWAAIRYDELGLHDHADSTVVRRETLEARPDMVRRFLAASVRAIRFMLDRPGEAAAITERHVAATGLTREQILRRIELQRPLVAPEDGTRLMEMYPRKADRTMAFLAKFGQVELPDCR